MSVFSRIFAAFGAIADAANAVAQSLNNFSATLRQADATARQSMGLEPLPITLTTTEPLALPEPEKKGRKAGAA